jgi:ATP-binding cassette subfamily B protein
LPARWLIILDEATSSVDTETELRVREALGRLVEGRTSLVIAHRLSTIQRASRILVMHKGQLREIGTHQELLALRGIYWKLYRLQYKDQELANGRPEKDQELANGGPEKDQELANAGPADGVAAVPDLVSPGD